MDAWVLVPAGVVSAAVATVGEEPGAHQAEENVHGECNLPHRLTWRENSYGGHPDADASRPEASEGGMRVVDTSRKIYVPNG